MSARDVRGFSFWVFCVLARSCVRAADMHDVCVWLWRASRRSFQELRGAHFEWRVLLTAAPSCRLFTRHCAMSARDVRGFSIVIGYFVFGFLARQGRGGARRVHVSGVRAVAQLSGRGTVVTLGGECC